MCHCFMGYFDVIPQSWDCKFLLYHRIDICETNNPQPKVSSICLYDLETKKSHFLEYSYANNWQIGTRAQFISSNEIAFNSIEGNFQRTLVINYERGTESKFVLEYPFWAYDGDSGFFIGVNFEVISNYRKGYGYPSKHKLNNRVCLYSFDRKNEFFFIELDYLIDLFGLRTAKNVYINHVLFRPSYDQFISLIFYEIEGKKFQLPFLTDIRFSFFKAISFDGFFSHHEWINENEIIAFAKN